ncbi:MAG: TolC family protein [Clostridia bacterium]|nr:TolC family protein [Clostridia bacterium]
MKKKLITALALCLSVSMATPALAVAATDVPAAIASNMTFEGSPVKISLQQAYDKFIADSSVMTGIKYQKDGELLTAQGLSESVHALSNPNAPDTTSKNLLKVERDFAKEVVEPNYEARVNAQKLTIFETYYNVKNAEENMKIQKENLDIEKELLKNASLKLKLGTISNMEYLTAEAAEKTAEDNYLSALNTLRTAKMGFNRLLGYGVMTNTSLSDKLTEVALPKETFAETLAAAKEKNLSVKKAAYDLRCAEENLKIYNAYPKSSIKYRTAYLKMLSAQTANENAPLTLEMDIRSKYMAMMEAYQQVQTYKTTVANAAEAARLAQLQFNAGMCTITDVQQAQLGSTQAKLGQSAALLKYNLAVENYKLCSGYGTAAADL